MAQVKSTPIFKKQDQPIHKSAHTLWEDEELSNKDTNINKAIGALLTMSRAAWQDNHTTSFKLKYAASLAVFAATAITFATGTFLLAVPLLWVAAPTFGYFLGARKLITGERENLRNVIRLRRLQHVAPNVNVRYFEDAQGPHVEKIESALDAFEKKYADQLTDMYGSAKPSFEGVSDESLRLWALSKDGKPPENATYDPLDPYAATERKPPEVNITNPARVLEQTPSPASGEERGAKEPQAKQEVLPSQEPNAEHKPEEPGDKTEASPSKASSQEPKVEPNNPVKLVRRPPYFKLKGTGSGLKKARAFRKPKPSSGL